MSGGRHQQNTEGNGSEVLTATQFQQELRGVIRFREQPSIEHPLVEAVKRIEQHPAYTQSRLLTRILAALTDQQGSFRRAEITSLDAETFAMVIGLMDVHAAGTSTADEWTQAVDAANAAQRAA
jgi:hypothetical protein